MPLFSTFGAIRYTCPPLGVLMEPAFFRSPALSPAWKFHLPLMKSSLLMFNVDATKPFTSTCAPCPNTMPFGLTRNTRPFDCSAPRMREGSWPMMRFSTALLGFC